MGFGFVTSEASGIPVVAFEGDMDGARVHAFEAAIIEAATSADNCVIVDLRNVTYIDSQTFGRLLKAHINLERVGGDVAILAGSGDVARAVKMLGGDCLLGVFDDQESAVAYLEPLISR